MKEIYNISDVEKFIADYEQKVLSDNKEWVVGIPLIGRKLYQKALLEKTKIDIFKRQYNKAINGEIDMDKFISDMSPVLEYFYSKNKDLLKGKKTKRQ